MSVTIPFWANVAVDIKDKLALDQYTFNSMIWYVSRCEMAGFVDSIDQARLCSLRFLAGKKKITPPGTRKKKDEAKAIKKMLKDVPIEITKLISELITESIVNQYRSGNTKIIDSLIGRVMKQYKYNPKVVRQLLLIEVEKT